MATLITSPFLFQARFYRIRGWVMDFSELTAVCKPVLERLDHALLNEIQGLENPTAENVACWLWHQFRNGLPGLQKIELKETPTSGVIYEGV
ncbi:6-pyruvoyl trahydropterin synthase family protein [Mucilaginibacter humi]